jgi:uncharacterized membrane protein YfcA
MPSGVTHIVVLLFTEVSFQFLYWAGRVRAVYLFSLCVVSLLSSLVGSLLVH